MVLPKGLSQTHPLPKPDTLCDYICTEKPELCLESVLLTCSPCWIVCKIVHEQGQSLFQPSSPIADGYVVV